MIETAAGSLWAKALQSAGEGVSAQATLRPANPNFASGVNALRSAGFNWIRLDLAGAFAANPSTGSAASITRTGTIAGETFSYTAYDLQFSSTPTNTITPGVVGGDVGALSNLTVESPAAQSGGVGAGSWGLDSGAVSTSRRSGLLVDFTTAPTAGVGHFGVDLIDFDYGDYNEYWHSKEDTLDKCSQESLDVIGRIVLAGLPRVEEMALGAR